MAKGSYERVSPKERALIQAELRKGTPRVEIEHSFGRSSSTISRIAQHTRQSRVRAAQEAVAEHSMGSTIVATVRGVKVTVEGPMTRAKEILNRILG